VQVVGAIGRSGVDTGWGGGAGAVARAFKDKRSETGGRAVSVASFASLFPYLLKQAPSRQRGAVGTSSSAISSSNTGHRHMFLRE
jgi:hypothetical protein